MKYARYPVTASHDRQVYEFYSEGPRGRIKKTIVYTQIGPGLFNLAFGDWDEKTQTLDDSNRSNNADRDQVLAIKGFINQEWQPFSSQFNYEAFLIKRK